MDRTFRKFMAVICAIAMVMSSAVVYKSAETKAASDYSGYEYEDIGNNDTTMAPDGVKGSQYYVVEGTAPSVIQFQGAGELYIAAPSAANLSVQVNGQSITAGPGAQVHVTNSEEMLTYMYNVVKISYDSGSITTIIIKNPNKEGTYESGEGEQTTTTTAPGESEEESTTEEESAPEEEHTIAVTSDDLSVVGFQIKTNNPDSVSYRSICKVPKVGSIVTGSDGEAHKIVSFGTAYAIDTNATGNMKKNTLDQNCTILDKVTLKERTENGKTFWVYDGAYLYNGLQRTIGYIASDESVVVNWDTSDTTNSYYVRTMTDMDPQMAYTIYVRPFIVDENGEIVYGTETAMTSVAQIADYIYKNSVAKNNTAHKYLYDVILHSENMKVNGVYNAYYRTVTIDYGWNGNLYLPKDPTYRFD